MARCSCRGIPTRAVGLRSPAEGQLSRKPTVGSASPKTPPIGAARLPVLPLGPGVGDMSIRVPSRRCLA